MAKTEKEMRAAQVQEQLEYAHQAVLLARQAFALGRYPQAAQYLSDTLVGGAIYQANGAKIICAALAEDKRRECAA